MAGCKFLKSAPLRIHFLKPKRKKQKLDHILHYEIRAGYQTKKVNFDCVKTNRFILLSNYLRDNCAINFSDSINRSAMVLYSKRMHECQQNEDISQSFLSFMEPEVLSKQKVVLFLDTMQSVLFFFNGSQGKWSRVNRIFLQCFFRFSDSC